MLPLVVPSCDGRMGVLEIRQGGHLRLDGCAWVHASTVGDRGGVRLVDVVQLIPVGDRPEPEWIEIEVTSNADVSNHLDRHHASDHVRSDGGDGDDESSIGLFRSYAAAAIVGVVALLLGWTIGRAGGSAEVATSEVTSPVTTERAQTFLMPTETLPSASAVTTRPQPTTTIAAATTNTTTTTPSTTLAPLTLEVVDIDPRLDQVGLTLVGVVPGGNVVELDLADQSLLRRDLGRISSGASIVVGDDWMAFPASGSGRTLVVRDDGSAESVNLGDPLLWRAGTDQFWRSGFRGWPGPMVVPEVDLTGEPTGVTVDLPANVWPFATGPSGRLLVSVLGKVYSIDEVSIEMIGAGELIGISSDVVVMHDCDDRLRCGLTVIDRGTGERRRLSIADVPGESASFYGAYQWTGTLLGTVSPDGTKCVVNVQTENGQTLGLMVDLRSGAFDELGDGVIASTVVWSPDSRLAFFLADPDSSAPNIFEHRELYAYDSESGEVFPVLADTMNWTSLSARNATT